MINSAQIFTGMCLLIVCLCFFAGCAIVYHKKRDTTPLSFADVLAFLNRVYPNGLRKLTDPLEEAYLRHSRTRAEFRDIQTLRFAALHEYFRKIVANAVALQNFGYRHLRGDDNTKRWLAHRLINLAVPVKMFGRAGLFALFVLRRFQFLDHALVIRLPILKHLAEETLAGLLSVTYSAVTLTALGCHYDVLLALSSSQTIPHVQFCQ